MQNFVWIAVILGWLCGCGCLHVHGTRIERITFHSSPVDITRVQLRVNGATDDVFVCSLMHCMASTINETVTLEWPTRRRGDVMHVLDARMHTLDWVAWGEPELPRSEREQMLDRIRHYGCMHVQDESPVRYAGLHRVGDGNEWAWIPRPTTASCLASTTLTSHETMYELDSHERVSALQLRWVAVPTGPPGLVFAQWLSHHLACSLPLQMNDAHENELGAIWIDPAIPANRHDDFWMYRYRFDQPSACPSVHAYRRQVAALLQCLRLSMLVDQKREDAESGTWSVPGVGLDTVGGSRVPRKLRDWQQHWENEFDVVPVFLCQTHGTEESDVTHFHSLLLVFSQPTRSHPLQLQSHTNATQAQSLLADVLLTESDDSIVLCPSYFQM